MSMTFDIYIFFFLFSKILPLALWDHYYFAVPKEFDISNYNINFGHLLLNVYMLNICL